jgi:transposase-like protein
MQARIEKNIHRYPVLFPSVGIYEVDETELTHIRLADGTYQEQLWVGGILHRATGRVVLFVLPDRSAPTLLHNIEHHIPAGSLVCTDECRSYRPMPSQYIHYSVNHSHGEYSKVVQDPAYGEVTVTTNHLESMWHRYRNFLANKQLHTMDRVLSGNSVFMFQHTVRNMFDLIKMKI